MSASAVGRLIAGLGLILAAGVSFLARQSAARRELHCLKGGPDPAAHFVALDGRVADQPEADASGGDGGGAD